MKKLMLALCLLLTAGIAKGAGRYLSVHYNSTSYNFSGYDGAKDNNFSLNGLGISYEYKWIPESLYDDDIFFYVGEGLILNYDFGNPTMGTEGSKEIKMKMQDFNIQDAVNFGYIFHVNDGAFGIAPFVGINAKLHCLTRGKYDGEDDWNNFYSKGDMGDDGKWKRFQLGWQAGVDFTFSCQVFLRLQYGTDFLPNYSYKKDGYKEKINSGNFRVALGYFF